MRETKTYKFFTEVNTFKIHVQAILNRLRKQNDPNHIVSAINLILEGQLNKAVSSAEIITLDSLLHHPEHYIKNMDPKAKEAIQSEIEKILKNFITEFNEDTICSITAPRV
ncbi:hypothetical protein OQJ26_04305 [Legionella sp. PATHC038]|uniref:hypothetical protein n=1 Tax=Legionella sheltonii TaxID=2992041 RepID=UPI0022437A77|nr:hypothetical protein [Legionella sp. PATHC038]MCW8398013.1 hypothetical protein [Legionella sp. PATHC038]